MASINDFCPECVDDLCVDGTLPILTSMCEVDNDEAITEVFVTDQGHPIAGDASLAASWTARLSNTSDGSGSAQNVANPIRHWGFANGQKPEGSPNYKNNTRGTGGSLQPYPRTVTFVDDDDSTAKYAMYRGYQCNGKVLMYYRSGRHFYGGSAGVGNGLGIKALIKPVYGIVTGTDGVMAHRWTVTIEWIAKCEEDRFVAPF